MTPPTGNPSPVLDLALMKQIDDGKNERQVAKGDSVTFALTIYNQGDLAAENITIVDHVPNGLTLDDKDWDLDGRKATTAVAERLAPGEQTQVDITFGVYRCGTEDP